MLTLPISVKRDHIDTSQETLLRLLFLVFGVFLVVWSFGRLLYGRYDVHPVLPLTTGAVTLAAAYLTGRVRPCVAATLGCSALMVAVVCRATVTGGLSSPAMLWASIPPFVAITLGGVRSAPPMTVMSAGSIGTLFLMHLYGGLPVDDTTLPMRLALSHAGLSGVLIFSAWHTRQRHRLSIQVVEDSNAALKNEISGHEQTRADLDTTYGEMLQIARRAGMGEVATGVLHNVGNALNGVNTSVALAVTAVDRADVSLLKVATLLEGEVSVEQQHKVAFYLRRLNESIAKRRCHLRDELGRIRQSAEHVAAIIQAQQRLATTGAVVEVVQANDLLSQSRLLLDASLRRHEIHLRSDLPAELQLSTDRHRVIQILTNLIGNARDSLRDAHGERTIGFSARQVDGFVHFDVRDTGAGVPAELHERIFTHGFTTKDDGHGFGLHASALAARDIGGELTLVPSNHGAHFRLVLPVDPAEGDNQAAPRPRQLAAANGG